MIFEIILTFIIFFVTKSIVFYLTDIKGLPDWLNYKPYNCYKCMSFWALITIYSTSFVLSNYHYWYVLITGLSITILDAIAKCQDEKKGVIINNNNKK